MASLNVVGKEQNTSPLFAKFYRHTKSEQMRNILSFPVKFTRIASNSQKPNRCEIFCPFPAFNFSSNLRQRPPIILQSIPKSLIDEKQ